MSRDWVHTASGPIPADKYGVLVRRAKSNRRLNISEEWVWAGWRPYIVSTMVVMATGIPTLVSDPAWNTVGLRMAALGVIYLATAGWIAARIRKLQPPDLQPFIDEECQKWRKRYGKDVDPQYRDDQIAELEQSFQLDGPSEPA